MSKWLAVLTSLTLFVPTAGFTYGLDDEVRQRAEPSSRSGMDPAKAAAQSASPLFPRGANNNGSNTNMDPASKQSLLRDTANQFLGDKAGKSLQSGNERVSINSNEKGAERLKDNRPDSGLRAKGFENGGRNYTLERKFSEFNGKTQDAIKTKLQNDLSSTDKKVAAKAQSALDSINSGQGNKVMVEIGFSRKVEGVGNSTTELTSIGKTTNLDKSRPTTAVASKPSSSADAPAPLTTNPAKPVAPAIEKSAEAPKSTPGAVPAAAVKPAAETAVTPSSKPEVKPIEAKPVGTSPASIPTATAGGAPAVAGSKADIPTPIKEEMAFRNEILTAATDPKSAIVNKVPSVQYQSDPSAGGKANQTRQIAKPIDGAQVKNTILNNTAVDANGTEINTVINKDGFEPRKAGPPVVYTDPKTKSVVGVTPTTVVNPGNLYNNLSYEIGADKTSARSWGQQQFSRLTPQMQEQVVSAIRDTPAGRKAYGDAPLQHLADGGDLQIEINEAKVALNNQGETSIQSLSLGKVEVINAAPGVALVPDNQKDFIKGLVAGESKSPSGPSAVSASPVVMNEGHARVVFPDISQGQAITQNTAQQNSIGISPGSDFGSYNIKGSFQQLPAFAQNVIKDHYKAEYVKDVIAGRDTKLVNTNLSTYAALAGSNKGVDQAFSFKLNVKIYNDGTFGYTIRDIQPAKVDPLPTLHLARP